MKHYNNIDNLPLFNYTKVMETSDVRHLLILPDYFELPETPLELQATLIEVWEDINYQIIEFMGVSEKHRQILRLEKTIALLKAQKMSTEDNSLDTIIEAKEIELQGISVITTDINTDIATLEVNLKMQIDTQKTSVKKYLSYIKILKK
jgi:hypothetical protein